MDMFPLKFVLERVVNNASWWLSEIKVKTQAALHRKHFPEPIIKASPGILLFDFEYITSPKADANIKNIMLQV